MENFSSLWRRYLPEVYEWLGSVELQVSSRDSTELDIIAVQYDAKEEVCRVCSDSLTNDETKELQKILSRFQYRGEGLLQLELESRQVVLADLGSSGSMTSRSRGFGQGIGKFLRKRRFGSVAIHAGEQLCTQKVFDGFVQGLYSVAIKEASSGGLTSHLKSVHFLGSEAEESALELLRSAARGVVLARFLSDAPPNVVTPGVLAQVAEDIAKDCPYATVNIRNSREIAEAGMGAFHSVSRGTSEESYWIELRLEGRQEGDPVCLVGKGLTFDSGGLSLKPPVGMMEMKFDLGGGAAVLGAASHFAVHQPVVPLVFLVGAVENMPHGQATRPSDVVRTYSGKTVEILNTDAEGRLVLCDLLAYATARLRPAAMVDLATLTGAALIGFGSCGAPCMGNDTNLTERFVQATGQAGEPVCSVPIWPELAETLKSDVADLKNIASPSVKAGTLVAGAFLQAFVGDTPWVHWDIAGTSYNCQASGYPASGGSGYGVRGLIGFVNSFASS